MEKVISSAILENYNQKLNENLDVNTAIVGGGPSGLICAYKLAKAGIKVALFESKLALGGGIWGGAMMFNKVVIQNEAVKFLDELSINYQRENEDIVVADSIELASALIYNANHAGAALFNNITAEDIILKNDRVSGIVINWTSVLKNGLHVDPLMVQSKNVLDATGHPSAISNIAIRKAGVSLNTPSGGVEGEKPMWAELGEELTVKHSKEIFPGLFVSGMAANGVSGSFRMGPIFGGMMLSGAKIADIIIENEK